MDVHSRICNLRVVRRIPPAAAAQELRRNIERTFAESWLGDSAELDRERLLVSFGARTPLEYVSAALRWAWQDSSRVSSECHVQHCQFCHSDNGVESSGALRCFWDSAPRCKTSLTHARASHAPWKSHTFEVASRCCCPLIAHCQRPMPFCRRDDSCGRWLCVPINLIWVAVAKFGWFS